MKNTDPQCPNCGVRHRPGSRAEKECHTRTSSARPAGKSILMQHTASEDFIPPTEQIWEKKDKAVHTVEYSTVTYDDIPMNTKEQVTRLLTESSHLMNIYAETAARSARIASMYNDDEPYASITQKNAAKSAMKVAEQLLDHTKRHNNLFSKAVELDVSPDEISDAVGADVAPKTVLLGQNRKVESPVRHVEVTDYDFDSDQFYETDVVFYALTENSADIENKLAVLRDSGERIAAARVPGAAEVSPGQQEDIERFADAARGLVLDMESQYWLKLSAVSMGEDKDVVADAVREGRLRDF